MGITTVSSPGPTSSVNSLVTNLGITIMFKPRFVANQATELEKLSDDKCKNKIPAIIIFRLEPIKRAFFHYCGIDFDQNVQKMFKKDRKHPLFGASGRDISLNVCTRIPS